jgi:hypothetical protein
VAARLNELGIGLLVAGVAGTGDRLVGRCGGELSRRVRY